MTDGLCEPQVSAKMRTGSPLAKKPAIACISGTPPRAALRGWSVSPLGFAEDTAKNQQLAGFTSEALHPTSGSGED